MAVFGPNYKVIIIGVGKTTLFHRILFDKYVDTTNLESRSTIGLDCFEKTVKVLGEQIRIDLQDCQGRERFRTRNISNLYHRANAVLLVYSVDETYSFENLQSWVEECMENLWGSSGRDLVWAVVGNKTDLYSEISVDRVEDFCETIGTNLSFFVSAKTGQNVDTMFKSIVETVHEQKLKMQGNGPRDSFVLSKSVEKKKCC